MTLLDLLKEPLRSGTIASLVMMPPGYVFRMLDLRVGHYGGKLAQVLFGSAPPMLLFAQHLVIGWVSAVPLLLFLARTEGRCSPVLAGAGYGALYYVAVNSLALPLAFGEPTPWSLGASFVYPSLIVHLVFGVSIGLTAQYFRSRNTAIASRA